jgi:hypothetical protein
MLPNTLRTVQYASCHVAATAIIKMCVHFADLRCASHVSNYNAARLYYAINTYAQGTLAQTDDGNLKVYISLRAEGHVGQCN